VVEAGRPEARVGSHAKGYNATSLGVVLVGGVRRDGKRLVAESNFTDAQWASLRRVLADLRERFPQARIVGHRDLNRGKECPSFSVRDKLAEWGMPNAWDGARPTSPAKRRAVQGTALTGAGALGATLTEAGNQVSFLADYGSTFKLLFVALILTGIGLTAYAQLRQVREDGV
jgi:hypothetical protein